MNSLNIAKLIKATNQSACQPAQGKGEKDSQSIDCIIHIGAGYGNDVHDYINLGAKKIVLVEAWPHLARKLEQKLSHASVNVINAAVTNDPNDSIFYQVQPFRYSGLNKPVHLTKVFQNLKFTEINNIGTITMLELMEKCKLRDGDRQVLVMQSNGSEYQCLKSLSKQELSKFSSLIIQIGNENYFENSRSQQDLIDLLSEKGFQLDSQSKDDAIFSHLLFSHDKLAELELEVQELKLLDQNQSIQIKQLESFNQSLKAELQQVTESLLTIQADKMSLQEQNDQAKIEQQSLNDENASLLIELKNAQQKSVQFESSNKTLTAELKHSTTCLIDFQNDIKRLEVTVKELMTQRDEEVKLHQKSKSWAESLNKQVATSKEELAASSRSIKLGQKMLAKAQVDLKHLQDSYAEKVVAEKELVELVKELREKLTLASKYYFKLQQEHPELLTKAEGN